MKENLSPSSSRHAHAWARARARGFEAASTGTSNPYAHGTQCWMLFEQGKTAAVNQRKSRDH